MALKPTSEIFTIGAKVTESAPNVFTEQRIDLQLNPLDNEVLAIYAVDIQNGRPEFIDGVSDFFRYRIAFDVLQFCPSFVAYPGRMLSPHVLSDIVGRL